MLSALRPPEHTSVPHNAPPRYTSTSASAAHSRVPTDPSELPPDRLHVEMEMSPDSQIILYGPLLRALISIKVRKPPKQFVMNLYCSSYPPFYLSLSSLLLSCFPPCHYQIKANKKKSKQLIHLISLSSVATGKLFW